MEISTLNQYYDRIVLLNLVERPDKLKHATIELNKNNISYDIYSAVKFPWSKHISCYMTLNDVGNFNYKTNPNEFSCALSHYNIIKKAYLDGINNIFVFEDDICFHNDYTKYIKSYFENLPEDTDMIMLSGFICDPEFAVMKKQNDYWKIPKRMWYACSYGLNSKAMKIYLDLQDECFRQADVPLYLMQEMDNVKCYCPNIPLIVQSKYLTSDLRETKNFEVIPNYYEQGLDYNNYFMYYGIESNNDEK